MTQSDNFWHRLLLLSEASSEDTATVDQLRAQLLGIDEGFSDSFDPADSFPEYVAVRLCRAVNQVLENEQQRRP